VSEQWRPVSGWVGYEVSDLGQVRSSRRGRVQVLRGGVDPRGYRNVTLFRGARSTKRQVWVHALVIEAFVGPRPEGMQVRHLNGDPTDNRLSNLAYGSPAENVADSFAHGTRGRASHCLRGHEFTPENTYLNARGHQNCRACRAIYRTRRRAA
jgi:hypothetical protein